MMQADLVAKVLAVSSVASKATGGVYWLSVPQDSSKRPHVVMFEVYGERDLTHGGESGLLMKRVQMDFIAATYADAVMMREDTAAALNGFKGTMIGTTVDLIEHIADSPDSIEDGSTLYMASADFEIHYQKT
jgi:hypothetical protein